MQENVYEILEKVNNEVTTDAKVAMLRHYNNQLLQDVLTLAYNPNIQFFTNIEPPMYRPDRDALVGMGHSHMGMEIKKIYLFVVNHPASKNLSYRKRDELLCQMLEALEPKEAEVLMSIIRKNLPLHGGFALAWEAFPQLKTW